MFRILRLSSAVYEKVSVLQWENYFCSVKLRRSSSSKSFTITTDQQTAKMSSNSTENCTGIVKFLELIGNLKHLKRTGWVIRDVNDCETISGHMYRMSMITFLLNGHEGLDRIKCMELALVHDLAESIVGDITPYCGVSKEEKKLREKNAMTEIAKLIEPRGQRLIELFDEYEENETPEAKFVKDLDHLDLVMQAFEYEKRDNCPRTHQEFFDATRGKVNHPLVKDVVAEIYSQRQHLIDNCTKPGQSSTSRNGVMNGCCCHKKSECHMNGENSDIVEKAASNLS